MVDNDASCPAGKHHGQYIIGAHKLYDAVGLNIAPVLAPQELMRAETMNNII